MQFKSQDILQFSACEIVSRAHDVAVPSTPRPIIRISTIDICVSLSVVNNAVGLQLQVRHWMAKTRRWQGTILGRMAAGRFPNASLPSSLTGIFSLAQRSIECEVSCAGIGVGRRTTFGQNSLFLLKTLAHQLTVISSKLPHYINSRLHT